MDARPVRVIPTSEHSEIGPSNSAGWSRCPSFMPDNTPSVHSATGTALHWIASQHLTDSSTRLEDFAGAYECDGYEIDIGIDELVAVETYVAAARPLYEMPFGGCEVRTSMKYLTGNERMWGTMDVWGFDPSTGTLHVMDAKFGRKPVPARENTQLLCYAIGILTSGWFGPGADVKSIRIGVMQPFLSDEPDTWTISPEDLTERAAELTKAYLAWLDPIDGRAMYNPSYLACQWCASKPSCPAVEGRVEEAISGDVVAVVDQPIEGGEVEWQERLGRITKLSPDELARRLEWVELVRLWATAVEDEAYERAVKNGIDLPGFKVVMGKAGPRKWSDPDKVRDLMKRTWRMRDDEMYKQVLITPPAAEKILKKEQPKRWAKLAPLITRSEGSPTLAPFGDPRPAIRGDDEFDDLTLLDGLL